jgi:AmmeMemoRadiSam system protein B/uncharacterized protein (TIGR00255 family)
MERSMRVPVVAGSFYPADPARLRALVSDLLGDAAPARTSPSVGVIVPHAGYVYSGRVAGAGLRAAAASGEPELIVILGASHSGAGGVLSLPGDGAWQTPLGDVAIDLLGVERARALGIRQAPAAFRREHSMEVVVPFLQVLFPRSPAILPVCVQLAAWDELREGARALGAAMGSRRVWIVASSDFTHYEPDRVARERDRLALDLILAGDAEGFYRLTIEQRLSICGAGAICILLLLARDLGLTRSSLVEYATSGSVNHRFLSVRIRSLADRPWLQSQIEEKIRGAFHRGDIGVWLSLAEEAGAEDATGFDREVARRVVHALEAARAEFGIEDPITLADLVRAGGLQAPQEDEESLWPAVEKALDTAVRALDSARAEEGRILEAEILRLVGIVEERAATAETRLPEIQEELRMKLRARIDELGLRVEPERLEAEVVLCVDRFDVQEELVRLRGHIGRVREVLRRGGAAGKELDFLCQEFLREANTLGSKVRDGAVAAVVVGMKVAIEQLKEQVQNVE